MGKDIRNSRLGIQEWREVGKQVQVLTKSCIRTARMYYLGRHLFDD